MLRSAGAGPAELCNISEMLYPIQESTAEHRWSDQLDVIGNNCCSSEFVFVGPSQFLIVLFAASLKAYISVPHKNLIFNMYLYG